MTNENQQAPTSSNKLQQAPNSGITRRDFSKGLGLFALVATLGGAPSKLAKKLLGTLTTDPLADIETSMELSSYEKNIDAIWSSIMATTFGIVVVDGSIQQSFLPENILGHPGFATPKVAGFNALAWSFVHEKERIAEKYKTVLENGKVKVNENEINTPAFKEKLERYEALVSELEMSAHHMSTELKSGYMTVMLLCLFSEIANSTKIDMEYIVKCYDAQANNEQIANFETGSYTSDITIRPDEAGHISTAEILAQEKYLDQKITEDLMFGSVMSLGFSPIATSYVGANIGQTTQERLLPIIQSKELVKLIKASGKEIITKEEFQSFQNTALKSAKEAINGYDRVEYDQKYQQSLDKHIDAWVSKGNSIENLSNDDRKAIINKVIEEVGEFDGSYGLSKMMTSLTSNIHSMMLLADGPQLPYIQKYGLKNALMSDVGGASISLWSTYSLTKERLQTMGIEISHDKWRALFGESLRKTKQAVKETKKTVQQEGIGGLATQDTDPSFEKGLALVKKGIKKQGLSKTEGDNLTELWKYTQVRKNQALSLDMNELARNKLELAKEKISSLGLFKIFDTITGDERLAHIQATDAKSVQLMMDVLQEHKGDIATITNLMGSEHTDIKNPMEGAYTKPGEGPKEDIQEQIEMVAETTETPLAEKEKTPEELSTIKAEITPLLQNLDPSQQAIILEHLTTKSHKEMEMFHEPTIEAFKALLAQVSCAPALAMFFGIVTKKFINALNSSIKLPRMSKMIIAEACNLEPSKYKTSFADNVAAFLMTDQMSDEMLGTYYGWHYYTEGNQKKKTPLVNHLFPTLRALLACPQKWNSESNGGNSVAGNGSNNTIRAVDTLESVEQKNADGSLTYTTKTTRRAQALNETTNNKFAANLMNPLGYKRHGDKLNWIYRIMDFGMVYAIEQAMVQAKNEGKIIEKEDGTFEIGTESQTKKEIGISRRDLLKNMIGKNR